MMYVQSLTPEDCFHIHLLKVESFSVLIENPFLKGGPTSMICDITTSLEPIVVQFATHTNVMWKREASSVQTVRTDLTVR